MTAIRLDDRLAIRACAPGDRESVLALWRACGFLAEGAEAPDLCAEPGADLLVATAAGGDGEVLATTLVGADADGPWVDYVAVAPAVRGRGYEHLMVAAAQGWLAARDPSSVRDVSRRDAMRVLTTSDGTGGTALKALMTLEKLRRGQAA